MPPVPANGQNTAGMMAPQRVDGVIKRARRASTMSTPTAIAQNSPGIWPAPRRCSCQNQGGTGGRRTSGVGRPPKGVVPNVKAHDAVGGPAPPDVALTKGATGAKRPGKKASVQLAGVLSMSDGAALPPAKTPSAPAPGTAASASSSPGAAGKSDADDAAMDEESGNSFGRAKALLAPFRRKSLVDRLMLGEQERLTRNPMRTGLDKLVIHPSNRLKILFDAIVQLATFYSLSVVPLQFAFGVEPDKAFDFFVDCLFMLDVVLHFFHGYVDRGYPVLSLELVAYRYFTSWFAVEFVASLPYDFIFTERTVYMVGLMRAFRLRRLGVAIANTRIGNRSSGLVAFLRVLYILGAWVVFAHVFACIFFNLGWRLRCSSPSYQATWLDELEYPSLDLPECPAVGAAPTADEWQASMVPVALLRGETAGRPSWLDMWVLSLHWAISSMSSLGYGKGPSGITMAEFSFTIFVQITGACLYAAIFGNIAQLIAKLDAPGARFRAQRDKIDEFVSFHELPSELTMKLHAYCKFLFAVNHGFDVGQISGALPPNLQHELLLHLHAPLVKSVPMFAECDDAFIKSIVLQLRPQVLLGGDAAFKAGESGTEMYFIMRGEMRMMDESLTVCYNALYSGAYFGELAMLTGQPRTATALAVTDCVLFYINQVDFNAVARKWPKALASILAKAKERLERINNCNSKSLAAQLGDRLSEVRQDIASETSGSLGLPSSLRDAAIRRGTAARSVCSPAARSVCSPCSQKSAFASRCTRGEGLTPLSNTFGGDGDADDSKSFKRPSAFISRNTTGAPSGSGTEGAAPEGGEAPAPAPDELWCVQIEDQVHRANQGVELILEQLHAQGALLAALASSSPRAAGAKPNGLAQNGDANADNMTA